MFHPSNDERIIDGASTLKPVDSPLDSKKRNEVSVLVFPSNLVSRNS
jgi:hypothetical protein